MENYHTEWGGGSEKRQKVSRIIRMVLILSQVNAVKDLQLKNSTQKNFLGHISIAISHDKQNIDSI